MFSFAVYLGISYNYCSVFLSISFNSGKTFLWGRTKCLSIIYIHFRVQVDKETESIMVLQHKYLNSTLCSHNCFTLGHIWIEPIKFRLENKQQITPDFFHPQWNYCRWSKQAVGKFYLIKKLCTSQQNTDNKGVKVGQPVITYLASHFLGTMTILCKVCGIR